MEDVPGAETVPLFWARKAMWRAFERVRSDSHDYVGIFAAVGETLWWAHVVSKHLRDRYQADYEAAVAVESVDPGPLLEGLLTALTQPDGTVAR